MGVLVCIILIVVLICREQSRAEEEILHKRAIKDFVNEVQLLKSCLDEEGLKTYNEKKKQGFIAKTTNSVPINQQVASSLNTSNNMNTSVVENNSNAVLEQDTQRNVNTEIIKEVKKERKIIQKETMKNNAILAVGSIFIVIAAISFLYTGWDVLHNAFKIGVLGILAVVFLMLSYLAKHKMKLPQTSKAFFYIAMGYIPIVFFSLSLLDLIGNYFSISGDGRFIYMFGVSIVIMLLYYTLSVKFKDSKLHVAAHVMQTLVLIFGMLAFNIPAEYKGILFIGHTFLFNIISAKTNIFPKTTNSYGLYQSIIHSFISLPFFLVALESPVYLMLSSIITMMVYYFLGKKYNIILFTIGGHILQTIAIFFACVALNLEEMIWIIAILIHSILFNLISSKVEKNKGINLDCGKLLFGMYFVISLIYLFYVWGSLMSVLIALLFLVNAFVIKAMNENEEWSKIQILRVFAYFFIVVLSFLKIKFFGNTYELPLIVKEILWSLVIGLTSVFYLKNPKSKLSKGGIFTNYIALAIISFIPSDVAKVLIPGNFFTVIGYLLVMLNLYIVKNKEEDIIKISTFVYTLFRLFIEKNIVSHIVYAIICVISWFDFERKEELQKYKIIPFIAYIIELYDGGIGIFSEYLIVPILISVGMVVLLEFLSFVKLKNNEPYVIMSLFYTILPFLILNESLNEYVLPVVLVFWSLVNLIITIDSLRIFVKLVMSISLLYIYENFVMNLFFINSTALIHLGFIVFLHFITRKLKNQKLSSYKAIEYIGLICIYLTALSSILTAEDALIYLIMLAVLVIVAYSKKYGPLFATTIVAIFVKLFELTAVFWFAIPWWGYLVVIGSVMIGFSMRNEKSNQNSKKLLAEKLKSAKEYLDI